MTTFQRLTFELDGMTADDPWRRVACRRVSGLQDSAGSASGAADRLTALRDAADAALRGGPADVAWGLCVREAASGKVLAAVDAERVFATASVGKVLLLVEVARQVEAGTLDPLEPVTRTAEDTVADSGLWQHLRADTLPLADAAALVGAVSDNLATNVLVRRIGLDAVRALTAALGLRDTALHDVVRDVRGPEHPPALSTGTAAELSDLFARLARGEVVSPAVSAQVLDWLAIDTDLSMVASAFGLDPLAHVDADRAIVLRHKTGTNTGVRADVGVVGPFAYAVLAGWDDAAADRRDAVLASMAAVGRALRAAL